MVTFPVAVLDPNVLRVSRYFRGLTLEGAARLTGFSPATLSRLERGLLPITADRANRLAPLLGPEPGDKGTSPS